MSKAILIVGATGKQGGATLHALAASADPSTQLLAVTRDASSASAQKLVARYPKQVVLVQGNLDDTEALFAAAKKATSAPIWGVFSVQLPTFNKAGAETEERQGKSLVDSSLRHGVSHFVYSSVDRHGPELSPKNPTSVPHFVTKHNIEQHLIAATSTSTTTNDNNNKMTWTILRPVAFYENLGGFQGKVFATAWRDVVRSRPLQIISTEDIGKVAAKALLPQNQARLAGRAISLVGDELTFAQFNKTFVDKTGHPAPTTFGFLARFVLWMVSELGVMYSWFDREGYGASVRETREVLPETKDFATWLEDQKARKLL
ncbi:uncharacterized protein B0I36DRAFT_314284 [Microdochium trichocladiopsis]|uniref:NmrA-like domain-containing protein n=1 Tax=Microdochium trichocladiopsis TaxID=1682393 RepID=A0A9P8YGJ2_9PEZI|nr:uncharacterized protein B0I36DRAFT_314284 [Microdochium trichocladiopsis]KAH7037538.1 hypothetical protein B0I36DRAFT_314284 [Microdochium trichocladiopsis]